MKAEIEGKKVFNEVFEKSNFLKRCKKKQEDCLEVIVKGGAWE